MANRTGKGQFVKGDPRAWTKGRPSEFSTFRKMVQEILHERAKLKTGEPVIYDGHAVTQIEAMVRRMVNDPRYSQLLFEYAFGKVPQITELTGPAGAAIPLEVVIGGHAPETDREPAPTAVLGEPSS